MIWRIRDSMLDAPSHAGCEGEEFPECFSSFCSILYTMGQ